MALVCISEADIGQAGGHDILVMGPIKREVPGQWLPRPRVLLKELGTTASRSLANPRACPCAGPRKYEAFTR
ncbi:hypothetical protein GCM10007890_50750 [Methylobacterium tardum]|uniref:Uncharacterized protein n=1 Tax=Methylobacterium tardum TaxID=374432 RepID=A0AA37WTG3_9HYPH|nr:hypothetical protein GCM10007890_50750 [Methylobacterium tardum]